MVSVLLHPVCFDALNVSLSAHQAIVDGVIGRFGCVETNPQRDRHAQRFSLALKPRNAIHTVAFSNQVILFHDPLDGLFLAFWQLRSVGGDPGAPLTRIENQLRAISQFFQPLCVQFCCLSDAGSLKRITYPVLMVPTSATCTSFVVSVLHRALRI